MPIRPENRALYPANWSSEIRPRILERDGHRCKQCGVRNHQLGGRLPCGRWLPARCQPMSGFPKPGDYALCSDNEMEATLRIVRIVLTIAHLHDPSPANCADDNLAALCQRCHNILDMPMRKANAAATRRAAKAAGDLFT